MNEEVVGMVAKNLLEAEKHFNKLTGNLDGLKRVLEVLDNIFKIRETKAQQQEDTEPLDSLLDECHIKLRGILEEQTYESVRFNFDFTAWANMIESDIRIQDPLMLSFDSTLNKEDQPEMTKSHKFVIRRDTAKETRTRIRQSGIPYNRGATTLLRVLQSNGKYNSGDMDARYYREQSYFCLTTVAWTFAVFGMMITIGFLASDFWAGQKNLAIEIERSQPTPLRLPAVTVCGNPKDVPTFSKFPTKDFPGLPLFGISRFIRNKRSTGKYHTIILPDTGAMKSKDSPVEDVMVSSDEKIISSLPQGFDVQRERKSMHDIRTAGSYESIGKHTSGAYNCVRIGKKEKYMLEPFETYNRSKVVTPAIEIRVFKSRLFSTCRANVFRRNRYIVTVFVSELVLFAKELEKRGILNFSGFNYSVLETSQMEVGDPYHIDFYCNVYFFSGFFYPSSDNASISYKYDPTYRYRWKKQGEGPYYSAYTWNREAALIAGPNPTAIQNDTYSLIGIRILAEDADAARDSKLVSPSTAILSLERQTATITFRRVEVEGKTEYRVKEEMLPGAVIQGKMVDIYHLKMDFSTFATERITATPTMSWPEFLTDVFEFVGLFTGICIFTLIVAPAHSLV